MLVFRIYAFKNCKKLQDLEFLLLLLERNQGMIHLLDSTNKLRTL